jgi:hypothetical protein
MLRFTPHRRLDDGAILIPDLGKQLLVGLAQGVRMLDAENRNVAVVVERCERRTPSDIDRLARAKHEID